jgi:hypothetical protein
MYVLLVPPRSKLLLHLLASAYTQIGGKGFLIKSSCDMETTTEDHITFWSKVFFEH